jgi:hypothetical protein
MLANNLTFANRADRNFFSFLHLEDLSQRFSGTARRILLRDMVGLQDLSLEGVS